MRLWVEPAVVDELADLPGNMRQRVRRAIRDLPTHVITGDGLFRISRAML